MSGVESESIPSSLVISASLLIVVPIKFASICATNVNTTGVPPAGKLVMVEVCGTVALNPVPLTNVKPDGKKSVTSIFAALREPSLVTVISKVTLSPGLNGPALMRSFDRAKSYV